MKTVELIKNKMIVNKNGFGALPIQRVSVDEAVLILQKAYKNGINFFDTARSYSDSEAKIGKAFDQETRKKIFIATKTPSATVEGFWKDLDASLTALNTDYIDLFQFHNPSFCPKKGDGTGLYEAMLEAKAQGKIRHIGITNHKFTIAKEAIASGLYETLQFPFSYLSTDEDVELVKLCKEAGMGFIAMKALSGGLITNSAAAYTYLAQFDNLVPIWGIQRESELDEFIAYEKESPEMTNELKKVIEDDRKNLSGEFCRGCGYCMPCPAGIEINICARMSLLLRRAPYERFTTPAWQEKMKKIEDCLNCGQCMSKCPYSLNTPQLLKNNYTDFKNFVKEHNL